MPEDPQAIEDDENLVQPLIQDNQQPFSPPTDPINDTTDDVDRAVEASQLDDTHQATDSNIEMEEVYDEGLAGAAEASEPNAGNAVVDYDPEQDQRKNGTGN